MHHALKIDVLRFHEIGSLDVLVVPQAIAASVFLHAPCHGRDIATTGMSFLSSGSYTERTASSQPLTRVGASLSVTAMT
jgi:hypothetical protein